MQEAEDSWQFDIFGFAQETPGHTLSLLALYLHKQTGFIADFRLNEGNLGNYMQKIESGYLAENPYHNRWLLQVCCFICAVVHALQPWHMSSCSTPVEVYTPVCNPMLDFHMQVLSLTFIASSAVNNAATWTLPTNGHKQALCPQNFYGLIESIALQCPCSLSSAADPHDHPPWRYH